MTYQEAIEALKLINTSRVHPFYDWEEMSEVRDIAIEALEKQIPKEPLNREERSEISYGYCPCCSNIIDDWNDLRYCGECGQAIKWEETE